MPTTTAWYSQSPALPPPKKRQKRTNDSYKTHHSPPSHYIDHHQDYAFGPSEGALPGGPPLTSVGAILLRLGCPLEESSSASVSLVSLLRLTGGVVMETPPAA